MQCLLFEIDGEPFALATESVEEVVPLVRATTLPDAPDWVRGVIDHRGRLLPLLDLPRMIGVADAAPTMGTRIVVAEVRLGRGVDEAAMCGDRHRIALLLGAVHDVIDLDPSVPEGFDGLPGGSMPHLGRLVPWSPGDGIETRSIRLVEIDQLVGESHRGVLFGSLESGGAS